MQISDEQREKIIEEGKEAAFAFAQAIAAAREADLDLVDFIVGTELPAYLHNRPDVFGALFMQMLPDGPLHGFSLSLTEKEYWLRVAHTIGLDWAKVLKETSIFMNKVA
jgi:hypothetical protein